MSNPTTPEACRAEQERVPTRLDYIKAHASVLDEMERYDELKVFRAASMLRETVAVIESLQAECAALLAAQAEALERLERVSALEKALRGAEPDVAATLRAILPAPPALASAEGASHEWSISRVDARRTRQTYTPAAPQSELPQMQGVGRGERGRP